MKVIKFIDSHQPSLPPGDYRIRVQQTVTVGGRSDDLTVDKDRKDQSNAFRFSVEGERFALGPGDIAAVYPPPDSIGNYLNVLPHVILHRSTLPWERTPLSSGEGDDAPLSWLALLLLEETEIDNGGQASVIATSELREAALSPIFWQGAQFDEARQPESVQVVDVPTALLKQILPAYTDLTWIAHVRAADAAATRSGSSTAHLQSEQAVVVGTRLPRSGAAHVVHLVSLEGLYQNGKPAFDETGDRAPDKIRLVSLKSWRFRCLDEEVYKLPLDPDSDQLDEDAPLAPLVRRLTQLEEGEVIHSKEHFLDRVRELRGSEVPEEQQQKLIELARHPGESFKGLLSNLNTTPVTLQRPMSGSSSTVTRRYVERGCVAAPHYLRRAGRTISFYHGPLVPGPVDGGFSTPADSADRLLIFDAPQGVFDVSYAAAWELGRLLALQDKRYARQLYGWRRAQTQGMVGSRDERRELQGLPLAPLQYHPQIYEDAEKPRLPDEILKFLERLQLLEGIPFNYLVPDERMLPAESLRFFYVDTHWIEALVDGALSIGRVNRSDSAIERKTWPAPPRVPTMTGFLLRSKVVAAWPDLQVDAYSKFTSRAASPPGDRLSPIRPLQKLSSDTLCGLFGGAIRTLDLHQAPTVLHFGIERDDQRQFTKRRRDDDGHLTEDSVPLDDVWRGHAPSQAGSPRVLDFAELALQIGADSGATFAMRLLTGVDKVRFSINRQEV